MTNAVPVGKAAELTRYHVRRRVQLPQLVLLAEMIEDLHTGDEGNPQGLSEILRRMSGEMDVQMKEEKLVLFPAIRKGAMSGIEASIAVMRAKRGVYDRDITRIRNITEEFTLPDAACTSWATLYAGLSDFIDDLMNHLRLENEMLFPQFGPVISRAANRRGSMS